MPKVSELIAEVERTLQESSVQSSEILQLINDCLFNIAERILLPELEAYGTVQTDPGTYMVDIPTAWNYGRGLYSVKTGDGNAVRVFPSLAHLVDKTYVNLDVVSASPIKYITIRGKKLIYYGTPGDVTTLHCKFYQKPTALVKTDIPTVIPSHLHRPLFVNYALWHLYALKEDGLEGLKTNTNYHKGLYEEAFNLLDITTITGISEPDIERETTWI